jgi:hypothetical protein
MQVRRAAALRTDVDDAALFLPIMTRYRADAGTRLEVERDDASIRLPVFR